VATENLVIVVNERGARVVKRNIQGIGRGAKQAEGAVSLLRRSLGLLGGALLIRGLTRQADAYINIRNRLRLVTSSTEELNAVQDRLLSISNQTRTSFAANADLYNRFAATTKNLGLSQEQVLTLTERINKAVIISGATAAEATGALRQLSQGLGQGQLRGQELLSVLEQLPFVADVIAKQLRTSRGELKRFGEEGKITSAVVNDAFTNFGSEIDQLFSRITPTIESSLVVLKNASIVLVGALSGSTGAGEGLARTILDIAEFVATDLTRGVIRFAESFGSVASQVSSGFASIFQDLGTSTGEVLDFLGKAIVRIPENIATVVRIATIEITAFAQRSLLQVQKFGNSIQGTINTILGRDEAVAENIQARLQLEQQIAAAERQILEERALLVNNAILQEEELTRATAERVAQVDSSLLQNLVGGFDVSGGTERLDKATEKLIDKQQDLLESLLLEEAAFRAAAATGEEYAVVLERLETNVVGVEAGTGALANSINEARERLRELQQQQDNTEFLQGLIEENAALEVAVRTGREVNQVLEEMAIAKEFANNPEGLQRALDLTRANERLQDQLSNAQDNITDFLRRARENAQDILGDALSDLFGGGLEDLPQRFAKVLLDLASQFLASEIFRLLGSIGGGPGSSDILGSIAGFFAGSFATGGQFQVPGSGGADSQLVAMRVTPRETVTVTPPNQAPPGSSGGLGFDRAPQAPNVEVPVKIINVTDPDEIAAALSSDAGERAIVNTIRKNKTQITAALR